MNSHLEAVDECSDGLDFMVNHCRCQAWKGAKEESRVHDLIGTRIAVESHSDRIRTIFPELNEHGLPEQVAAEKHAVADLVVVEVLAELAVGEGGGGADADHEAEPGAVGAVAAGVPGEAIR